jgi:hypothetical protein
MHRKGREPVLQMHFVAALGWLALPLLVQGLPAPEQDGPGGPRLSGAPPYFADALLEQSIERLLNPDAAVHLEAHRAFGVESTRFADFAMCSRQVYEAPVAG